jgi:hypothetical protein
MQTDITIGDLIFGTMITICAVGMAVGQTIKSDTVLFIVGAYLFAALCGVCLRVICKIYKSQKQSK